MDISTTQSLLESDRRIDHPMPTQARTAGARQFFSRKGTLSKWHPNYEFRPGQVEMAEAVESALADKRHLIVEAGTGTGKTLAYLVPALLSGKRIVVSTGTKNLQRSEEHTSELQSSMYLVCRLLLEKKNKIKSSTTTPSYNSRHLLSSALVCFLIYHYPCISLLRLRHPPPSTLFPYTTLFRSLADKRHLIVEAGTGTGKTLAYLVPALLSGKRIVVSTGTKNLQEQLFFKDVPFLQRHFPRPLKVCYMKGRNNYACRQKIYDMEKEPVLTGLEE